MNIEGFDLEEDQIETFQDVYGALSKNYTVEVIDCDQIDDVFGKIEYFRSFAPLQHYLDFRIINIFHLNPEKESIKIVNAVISFNVTGERGRKEELSDVQSFGFTELDTDFGHVLMTPETSADRLVDFFVRQDIDFRDNKEFSDNFHLTGTNKELVRSKFNMSIQSQVLKTPEIQLEIKGKTLLVKLTDSMSVKDSLAMAKALQKFK